MASCQSSHCALNGCAFPQACPNDAVTADEAGRAFEFCGRLLGPNWYARLRQIVSTVRRRPHRSGGQ